MPRKPKVYLLIQARTDSSRLFGKCLFLIKNKETILLLHDRVKSKNYKTIILTSNEKSDDYLVELLKKKKIKYFRGDLENVRDRFLKFSKKLKKEDILIRCTGDNLFLDKYFIKNLIFEFQKSKLQYLNIDREKSLLPYGMGAEVFTVDALKLSVAKSKFDLEHVTPPLKRKRSKTKSVVRKINQNLYNYRCTSDSLYDFFCIKKIFENHKINQKTHWLTLCKNLKILKKQNIENEILKIFNKITIGTAQFDGKYGINNENEKINFKEISKILDYASHNYINNIDTAWSYKKSEKNIGNYLKKNSNKFKITSKFKIKNFEKINISLNRLNLKKLYLALLHDPQILIDNKNIISKIYNKFKKKFKYFGASINFPREYYFLKNNPYINHFQIPYNIVDDRWNVILDNKKKNTIFHARSIFLQGLLLKKKLNYPKILKKNNLLIQKKVEYLTKKLNRFDAKDLMFSYVASNKRIDKIIIGVDSINQVQQLPFYLLRNNLTNSDLRIIKNNIPKVNEVYKSPVKWKF